MGWVAAAVWGPSCPVVALARIVMLASAGTETPSSTSSMGTFTEEWVPMGVGIWEQRAAMGAPWAPPAICGPSSTKNVVLAAAGCKDAGSMSSTGTSTKERRVPMGTGIWTGHGPTCPIVVSAAAGTGSTGASATSTKEPLWPMGTGTWCDAPHGGLALRTAGTGL